MLNVRFAKSYRGRAPTSLFSGLDLEKCTRWPYFLKYVRAKITKKILYSYGGWGVFNAMIAKAW